MSKIAFTPTLQWFEEFYSKEEGRHKPLPGEAPLMLPHPMPNMTNPWPGDLLMMIVRRCVGRLVVVGLHIDDAFRNVVAQLEAVSRSNSAQTEPALFLSKRFNNSAEVDGSIDSWTGDDKTVELTPELAKTVAYIVPTTALLADRARRSAAEVADLRRQLSNATSSSGNNGGGGGSYYSGGGALVTTASAAAATSRIGRAIANRFNGLDSTSDMLAACGVMPAGISVWEPMTWLPLLRSNHAAAIVQSLGQEVGVLSSQRLHTPGHAMLIQSKLRQVGAAVAMLQAAVGSGGYNDMPPHETENCYCLLVELRTAAAGASLEQVMQRMAGTDPMDRAGAAIAYAQRGGGGGRGNWRGGGGGGNWRGGRGGRGGGGSGNFRGGRGAANRGL